MFWVSFVLALLSAAIVTGISSLAFRWKGPWDNVWAYFAVLFMACWSGSLWLNTGEPVTQARSWLPLLFIAVLLVFALAASSASSTRAGSRVPVRADLPPSRTSGGSPAPSPESGSPEAITLGIFFWALLGLLGLAIAWGIYFRAHQ